MNIELHLIRSAANIEVESVNHKQKEIDYELGCYVITTLGCCARNHVLGFVYESSCAF